MSNRGRQEEIGRAESLESPEPVPKLDGVVAGRLVDVRDALLVDFHGNLAGAPIRARTIVNVTAKDCGAEVVLMFEGGDPSRPIVLGVVRDAPVPTESQLSIEVDGRRIELVAERELVLRAGKASVTLTAAGKVLIRGEYVLSRSTGVNRIQGGSVQIN